MELIETMLVTNGNIKNFNYHLERVKKHMNILNGNLMRKNGL